ncbi:HNH endonuclease signature motif containing protein [Cesiribacter andamanensis]|uniref:HNH endonuclease signature motif containing protein n=1 Tax=Cesiribacter andamanensis TaxID=649507 RepID=UPI000344D98A|nr:HNH endonuclease signature motif containing protein [Cesiribacter andamanensis]
MRYLAKISSSNRDRNQRFYQTPAWKRVRLLKLQECPLCVTCDAQGLLTVATEVDHIQPLNQAWNKRLDWDNLQCLCKPCHSAKTRAEQLEKPQQGRARRAGRKAKGPA